MMGVRVMMDRDRPLSVHNGGIIPIAPSLVNEATFSQRRNELFTHQIAKQR
jgi:hypothetical protein